MEENKNVLGLCFQIIGMFLLILFFIYDISLETNYVKVNCYDKYNNIIENVNCYDKVPISNNNFDIILYKLTPIWFFGSLTLICFNIIDIYSLFKKEK